MILIHTNANISYHFEGNFKLQWLDLLLLIVLHMARYHLLENYLSKISVVITFLSQ